MEIMWDLIATYRSMDRDGLLKSMANHIEFSQCKNRYTAEDIDIYRSFALSIRDRLVEFWNDTQQTYHRKKCKQLYPFCIRVVSQHRAWSGYTDVSQIT